MCRAQRQKLLRSQIQAKVYLHFFSFLNEASQTSYLFFPWQPLLHLHFDQLLLFLILLMLLLLMVVVVIVVYVYYASFCNCVYLFSPVPPSMFKSAKAEANCRPAWNLGWVLICWFTLLANRRSPSSLELMKKNSFPPSTHWKLH